MDTNSGLVILALGLGCFIFLLIVLGISFSVTFNRIQTQTMSTRLERKDGSSGTYVHEDRVYWWLRLIPFSSQSDTYIIDRLNWKVVVRNKVPIRVEEHGVSLDLKSDRAKKLLAASALELESLQYLEDKHYKRGHYRFLN